MKRMRLGLLLGRHGDHAKAREQYLAAAASAETLHAKDVLMVYLLGAGTESLALDDAPAAIDQYRRCADVARELGKPGEEVLQRARAGLGRALVAAQQDAEAITELEWALPRLEIQAVPPAGLGITRFALAEALWRRNGSNDRARARVRARDRRPRIRGGSESGGEGFGCVPSDQGQGDRRGDCTHRPLGIDAPVTVSIAVTHTSSWCDAARRSLIAAASSPSAGT
jgi:hypothetical protein